MLYNFTQKIYNMNRLRTFLSILVFCVIGFSTSAQVKQTLHKTYEVKKINTIELDVAGNVEFKKWNGTSLMVKTQISLGNATERMLQHLIRKKRYNLEVTTDDKVLTLTSIVKERKQIITQMGECREDVDILIYVPKNFEVSSTTTLSRTNIPPSEIATEETTETEEETGLTGDE